MVEFLKRYKVLTYSLVIFISFTANWLVQFFYYLYKINGDPFVFNGLKTLFDYKTGIIGDVVILPFVNVIAAYVMLNANFKLSRKILLIVFAAALITDVSSHFLQGYLALVNWSMPRPFEWNFVSYWHMFSFFWQIAYLYLFFYVIWHLRTYKTVLTINWSISACLIFLLIFSLLFIDDYYFNWISVKDVFSYLTITALGKLLPGPALYLAS